MMHEKGPVPKRPSFRPVASELVRRLSDADVLALTDILLQRPPPVPRERPALRVVQGGKKS